MKARIYFSFLLCLFVLEGGISQCPSPTTLLHPGSHVATCGVTNANDPVLGIMYAENSSYSTSAIMPTTYYNPGWTAQNIGNIYFA